MTYLHDLGIVHGNLKGVRLVPPRHHHPHWQMNQANILIDDTGAALVADFGLMTMIDLSTFLSETVHSPGGTWRWMSPKLLDPESFGSNGRLTRGSDRYALGMVIYEVSLLRPSRWSPIYTFQVLTGLKPFYNTHDPACILAVAKGRRPPKPPHAELLGFSDTLWGLTQSCWNKTTSARPTACQLLECLSLSSPTWVPPAVYPVVAVDLFSIADLWSTDSEDIPHGLDARGTGSGNSARIFAVPIVVVFLFLSIISVLFFPVWRSE